MIRQLRKILKYNYKNNNKKLILFNIFKDEHGFSTLSIVVSLLLSLSLIFSTAQVYKIYTASSDIQNVSDSCTLAAENQIAEFMILVRLADSTSLSLSLAGIVSTGIGVVAMCIPFTATIGDALLDCAHKLFDARDKFADNTSKNLNRIEKSLPFIASVKAYQLAVSNNSNLHNADYLSIVLLMPGKGAEITPGNIDNAKDSLKTIENQTTELKEAAQKAEEASIKANESKLEAFNADCGNNPNYCMYERAKNKAYMEGSDNPLYKNIDNWSFEIALKRVQAYYPKRYNIEKPEGTSVEQISNSELRKIFYKYAMKQMQNAYVLENDEKFDAYFPHLPKNTEEMKKTEIYTSEQFPVTSDGNTKTMHAYANCPNCKHITENNTLNALETGLWKECEQCKFNASSMGKVAQASSAIDNGFEYHYNIIEKTAKDYQNAINEGKPASNKVKNIANNIFDKIKELIKDIFNKRIYAKPPGAYGAIGITINKGQAPASDGFSSAFVASDGNLGIRVAISGATLVEEDSDESKNLLSSLNESIADKIPIISGPSGIILNSWAKLLNVYNLGQEGLSNSIETSLNQIPLSSASGLGTWASKKFQNFIKECGLEPANIKALKPVLINTYHIANKEINSKNISNDDFMKNFAFKYINIKENAIKNEKIKNNILQGISNTAEMTKLLNLDEAISTNGQIEIAVIEPLGDMGPNIPIYIKLPKFATDSMSNIVSALTNVLQSLTGLIGNEKIWK